MDRLWDFWPYIYGVIILSVTFAVGESMGYQRRVHDKRAERKQANETTVAHGKRRRSPARRGPAAGGTLYLSKVGRSEKPFLCPALADEPHPIAKP